jgi:hypothetical protein
MRLGEQGTDEDVSVPMPEVKATYVLKDYQRVDWSVLLEIAKIAFANKT